MKALDELATDIAAAKDGGWLADHTKLARWHELVEVVRAQVGDEWLAEPAFRRYSGRSDWWCRRHFAEYEAVGTARKRGKRREWSKRACPTVATANEEDLVREITRSFQEEVA